MTTIIFVGLGNMGSQLVKHIETTAADHDSTVVVYDLDPAKRAAVARDLGVTTVDSLDLLEGRVDVLCLSVPDGAATKKILAIEQVGKALAGGVVFDFSSIAPADAREIADDLQKQGTAYFDAPVTGEVKRGSDGTLLTMIGGESDRLAEYRWIPESFSRALVDSGRSGNGALLKTLNNMIANVAAVASMEGIVLARAAGVGEAALLEVFNSGVARTHFSASRYPDHIATGAFDHGFPLGLVNKDLGIAEGSAEALGAQAAVFNAARALWREALDTYGPTADTTRVIDIVSRRTVGQPWEALSEQSAPTLA